MPIPRDISPLQEDDRAAVIASAEEGITLIRDSMLSVLEKHQVTVLPVLGQPFDPSYMHALGQHPAPTVPPNTVVQEVVRGYRWQGRILREAQVIVAVPPERGSSVNGEKEP